MLKKNELTLLAVHAHPDDESMSTGGILAKYSAQGLRTVLAYGTGGEAGDILNPEFVAPKPGLDMKEIRAIELEAAVKKERGEEPGFDPDIIGTPEDKISTVVDVREYVSRKLEALNCQQSQMNPNSVIRRMSEEFKEEVMGYEHFQCVHGCTAADTKETDFFEEL